MKKKTIFDECEKLNKTPYERGFMCMQPDNCQQCIKAACEGQTTTPCEDELEEDGKPTDGRRRDKLAAMGIYTTPHEDEIKPEHRSRSGRTSFNVWECWLRLERGGIMGLPYPADNEEKAKELAQKAANIFGGKILDVHFVECLESKI